MTVMPFRPFQGLPRIDMCVSCSVLGDTNGYGEAKSEYAAAVVVSDQPLTWADLKVALGQ